MGHCLLGSLLWSWSRSQGAAARPVPGFAWVQKTSFLPPAELSGCLLRPLGLGSLASRLAPPDRLSLPPGYPMPWEDPALPYPRNYAHPLHVALRASDGASDYGNKFGEPVLAGECWRGRSGGLWGPILAGGG